MTRMVDLTDRTFGSLLVLRHHPTGKPQSHWLCRCACGNLVVVRSDNLLSGRSTRCSECRNGCGRQSVFLKEGGEDDGAL